MASVKRKEMQSLLIFYGSSRCKSSIVLEKTDHISDFRYKMEIRDQIQKPPKITESFLSGMGLSAKSVIGKNRNTSLCVLHHHIPHLWGPKWIVMSVSTVLYEVLQKKTGSCFKFCGWCGIWINIGLNLIFLKTIWEQWRHIAFNSIAFYSALRKRELRCPRHINWPYKFFVNMEKTFYVHTYERLSIVPSFYPYIFTGICGAVQLLSSLNI